MKAKYLHFLAMVGLLSVQESRAAEESPHAAAIELVMATQTAKIRSVDDDQKWWLDTKDRSWSARRTIAPGRVDTTHYFEVTYKIDGAIVAVWMVDTAKGGVTEVATPRTNH